SGRCKPYRDSSLMTLKHISPELSTFTAHIATMTARWLSSKLFVENCQMLLRFMRSRLRSRADEERLKPECRTTSGRWNWILATSLPFNNSRSVTIYCGVTPTKSRHWTVHCPLDQTTPKPRPHARSLSSIGKRTQDH